MAQLEPLALGTRPRRTTQAARSASMGGHRQAARLSEWTARPLGRLGRPLLDEVDTYLGFWAIVRAEDAGS
jgi:hypothetical protein